MQVAVITAEFDIPVGELSPKISGFRKIMYAIAKNVVKPAIISVRTLVPCCESLNSLSSVPVGAVLLDCVFVSSQLQQLMEI